jgi:hypothetical protein
MDEKTAIKKLTKKVYLRNCGIKKDGSKVSHSKLTKSVFNFISKTQELSSTWTK